MKKKKLIITKENYKGYLELYLLKMNPFTIKEEYSEVDEKECCRLINFMTMNSLICLLDDSKQLLDMIKEPNKQNDFFKNFINENNKGLKERLILQRKDLINIYIIFQMLKMKYPYIDLDIETSDIESALISVGLLKIKKIYNKTFYKIDYKSFEEYLKLDEKVKEISFFDDFHYQAIHIPNSVKVKVK